MISIKLKDVRFKNLIVFISNCTFFTIQLILTAMFFTGTISYFGESITVIGAVNLLLDVFNIAVGAIFEYLLKLALGIVYIVATVIVIKNLVSSISYFIQATVDKSEKAEQIKENAFFSLYSSVGSTLKACLMFMVLCLMASVDYKISDAGTTVIIFGVIAYLAFNGVLLYLKNYTLETILYKSGSIIVMLVAYFFIFSQAKYSAFENMFLSIRTIFNGYLGEVSANAIFTAMSLIATPILYLILQFGLLGYVGDIWYADYYLHSNEGNYASGKIMGLTIAIVSVNLVTNIIINNISEISVQLIIDMIGDQMPILIATIALFVAYKFNDYEEVRGCEEEPVIAEASAKEEEVESVEVQPVVEEVKVEEKPAPVVEEVKPEIVPEEKEVAVSEPAPSNTDVVSELKKFKELLDSGIITKEEFDAKKKQLLGL